MSSSVHEPEVFKVFGINVELNPCQKHRNLTIKLTYQDTTGELRGVTDGPFSYSPKPSICDNGKLTKHVTLEDALASLREEEGGNYFVTHT